MRQLAWILALVLPVTASAVPANEALHLLLRTGGQPSPNEVKLLEPLSYDTAVDRIVDQAKKRRQPLVAPPDWVNEPIAQRIVDKKSLSQDEQNRIRRMWTQRYLELQGWWLDEMVRTDAPLAEHMTLFWSGHFTSSLQKVRWGQLLYRQNLLLREQALGNFGTMLHAIARDPAMIAYLDTQSNRKAKPNENFARELLELFTLGEGHYSEQDIKEVARAFTGWNFSPPDAAFSIEPRYHDDDIKAFLGRSGKFGGDEIIDILLQQPRTAEFIVGKLWLEFVSPTPDTAAVQRLAASFRKDWEIAPLIKALLKEPAFRDPQNRGVLVKSPVEFVVGTLRLLSLPMSPQTAAVATVSMGQSLMNPPNVKGWPGGTAWISSQTLLARRQFLNYLTGDAEELAPTRGATGPVIKVPLAAMKAQQVGIRTAFGTYAESQTPMDLVQVLLVLPPVSPPPESAKPPDRLETWLLDPVYNLK